MEPGLGLVAGQHRGLGERQGGGPDPPEPALGDAERAERAGIARLRAGDLAGEGGRLLGAATARQLEQGAREAGKDPAKMPRMIQLHVSWAESDEAATEAALREWPNGGMAFPKGDIRNPEDFAAMAKLVRPEHFRGRVLISADLEVHREHIQHFIDLGFTEVYVHNVGRNQEEFIKAYGERVIPNLRWPEAAPVATTSAR